MKTAVIFRLTTSLLRTATAGGLFQVYRLSFFDYVFVLQNLLLSPFASVSGYLVRYLPATNVFELYCLLLDNSKVSIKKGSWRSQAALTQEVDSVEEQIALLNAAQPVELKRVSPAASLCSANMPRDSFSIWRFPAKRQVHQFEIGCHDFYQKYQYPIAFS